MDRLLTDASGYVPGGRDVTSPTVATRVDEHARFGVDPRALSAPFERHRPAETIEQPDSKGARCRSKSGFESDGGIAADTARIRNDDLTRTDVLFRGFERITRAWDETDPRLRRMREVWRMRLVIRLANHVCFPREMREG